MTQGINGPDGFKVVENKKEVHTIGKIVAEETFTKKQDAAGNSIWTHEFKDTDNETGEIKSRIVYEDHFVNDNKTKHIITEYDSSGNVKYAQKTSYQDKDGDGWNKFVTEIDKNGDGKIDEVETVTHERRSVGPFNINETITKIDDNADGITDGINIVATSDGRSSTTESRTEFRNGKLVYYGEVTDFRNENGDLVRSEFITDKNGDGKIDSIKTEIFEKQKDGSEKWTTMIDSDADGSIDSTEVSYFKNGQIFYEDEYKGE